MNEVNTDRIGFIGFIEVSGANPNGDAEDGSPRTDTKGHGVISAFSIKRHLRDWIHVQGLERILLVRTDDAYDYQARNTRYFANEEVQKAIGDVKKLKKVSNGEWYDVRAFGLMMLNKSAKNKARGTAVKDDDETVVSHEENFGINGAVTIGHAVTKDHVDIEELPMAMSYNQKQDGYVREKASYGSSIKYIRHAVYKFIGGINPITAKNNGFSKDDADLMRRALENLYELDPSATRPEGSVLLRTLFWFEYNGAKQSEIKDLVDIKLNDGLEYSNSIRDYTITFNETQAKKLKVKYDISNYGANIELI